MNIYPMAFLTRTGRRRIFSCCPGAGSSSWIFTSGSSIGWRITPAFVTANFFSTALSTGALSEPILFDARLALRFTRAAGLCRRLRNRIFGRIFVIFLSSSLSRLVLSRNMYDSKMELQPHCCTHAHWLNCTSEARMIFIRTLSAFIGFIWNLHSAWLLFATVPDLECETS